MIPVSVLVLEMVFKGGGYPLKHINFKMFKIKHIGVWDATC